MCVSARGAGVEDEFHFLMKCTKYASERDLLTSVLKHVELDLDSPLFVESCLRTTFVNIMMCTHPRVIKAVVQYVWSAFRVRELFMKERLSE